MCNNATESAVRGVNLSQQQGVGYPSYHHAAYYSQAMMMPAGWVQPTMCYVPLMPNGTTLPIAVRNRFPTPVPSLSQQKNAASTTPCQQSNSSNNCFIVPTPTNLKSKEKSATKQNVSVHPLPVFMTQQCFPQVAQQNILVRPIPSNFNGGLYPMMYHTQHPSPHNQSDKISVTGHGFFTDKQFDEYDQKAANTTRVNVSPTENYFNQAQTMKMQSDHRLVMRHTPTAPAQDLCPRSSTSVQYAEKHSVNVVSVQVSDPLNNKADNVSLGADFIQSVCANINRPSENVASEIGGLIKTFRKKTQSDDKDNGKGLKHVNRIKPSGKETKRNKLPKMIQKVKSSPDECRSTTDGSWKTAKHKHSLISKWLLSIDNFDNTKSSRSIASNGLPAKLRYKNQSNETSDMRETTDVKKNNPEKLEKQQYPQLKVFFHPTSHDENKTGHGVDKTLLGKTQSVLQKGHKDHFFLGRLAAEIEAKKDHSVTRKYDESGDDDQRRICDSDSLGAFDNRSTAVYSVVDSDNLLHFSKVVTSSSDEDVSNDDSSYVARESDLSESDASLLASVHKLSMSENETSSSSTSSEEEDYRATTSSADESSSVMSGERRLICEKIYDTPNEFPPIKEEKSQIELDVDQVANRVEESELNNLNAVDIPKSEFIHNQPELSSSKGKDLSLRVASKKTSKYTSSSPSSLSTLSPVRKEACPFSKLPDLDESDELELFKSFASDDLLEKIRDMFPANSKFQSSPKFDGLEDSTDTLTSARKMVGNISTDEELQMYDCSFLHREHQSDDDVSNVSNTFQVEQDQVLVDKLCYDWSKCMSASDPDIKPPMTYTKYRHLVYDQDEDLSPPSLLDFSDNAESALHLIENGRRQPVYPLDRKYLCTVKLIDIIRKKSNYY